MGYQKYEKEVIVVSGKPTHAHIELKESKVLMDEVVISASRVETSRKEAPVIVNVMSEKTFQQSNAQDISQALPFQSGVRVEYSCQNCGFSQVRINGMDGPYSQILIDSKPIMSALGGVYGLEQMPVNMVERIEVIKGAGSALYGANAIAGTINIITKEPLTPSYSIGTDLQAVGMKAYAQNFNSNAVVIGKNNKSGASFYQTFRKKTPYDHDGDGFSEIGKLDAFSFGTRSFYKLSNTQKLTLEYHTMQETRRGGNAFDKPPHESDITEMTDHKIHSGGLNYDYISLDGNSKYSIYTSAQLIDRESYFGAHQDLNAYGRSNDATYLIGTQGYNKIDKFLFLPASLVYGLEVSGNNLVDSVPAYGTGTKQETNVIGAFAQSEWKAKYFRFVVGGRLDKHNLIKTPIFSPRLNIMYTPSEDLQVRASYGSGYRAPQSYDEDLHATQLGGQTVRTTLDPNLRPEYSHSFSLSSDYYVQLSDDYQANFLLEGFYTNLTDIFALKVVEDSLGDLTQLRYNASGAKIGGVSITAKVSYQAKYTLTLGYTYQQSKYDDPQIWSDEPTVIPTRKMLRTPDNYAYATLSLIPIKPMNISLSGTYTGKMLVPHYAGYIHVPTDRLETTPTFFDLNLVASYDFKLKEDLMFQIGGGIKNMFNSYQRDFDQGPDRDASYIYGPMLPRTIYISLKLYSK